MQLLARYRTKAKSEVAQGHRFVDDEWKFIPNEFDLAGSYRDGFSKNFAMSFMLDGRFSEETENPFSGVSLYGGGVLPEVSLSSSLTLTGWLLYYTGSMKGDQKISGSDVGVRVGVNF